jgi:2'-5' RNA ligase
MRVFIGIRLDQPTKEKIKQALTPFKKISTPIKWVKPENWHLTLKFIGEVPEDKNNQIMDNQYETGPFELSITGFGKFGRENNLNIFWAGIDRNESLNQIHATIETSLANLGIKKENRPFSGHLTLGRNRKSFYSAQFFSLIEKNQSLPICRFTVKGFQIFESILTPEGPIYKTLQEIGFEHS